MRVGERSAEMTSRELDGGIRGRNCSQKEEDCI